jgi:hypothetical protein
MSTVDQIRKTNEKQLRITSQKRLYLATIMFYVNWGFTGVLQGVNRGITGVNPLLTPC